jgi:hypothetical protein
MRGPLTGRAGRAPITEPARNRCRCGHFPTTHLGVTPIGPGGGVGYQLEPVAPCAICGAAACPKFAPTV